MRWFLVVLFVLSVPASTEAAGYVVRNRSHATVEIAVDNGRKVKVRHGGQVVFENRKQTATVKVWQFGQQKTTSTVKSRTRTKVTHSGDVWSIQRD